MEKVTPVIIFLGAPGAGKGTQAELLSERKSIPRISTGDMLRHAVQDDSELGRKVKEIMNEGRLVDDETMLVVVQERIRRPDCHDGFILDGYPRNVAQAASLVQVLEPYMKMRVIEISLSDEDILKRVAGRRTCPECEQIYNIYFAPAKNNETCDFDGMKLFIRKDDREDVVRKRLATYKKETFPLIDHYRKLGVLNVLNGFQPKDKLAEQIMELV